MKYLITYAILYFIGLYYLLEDKELKKGILSIVSQRIYVIALSIVSLFLAGWALICLDAYLFIKKVLIVSFVYIVVWRIKRKYKIK